MSDFYPGYGDGEWRSRFAKNEIEWVDPETLVANPFNHRIHEKLQQEQVETLIEKVGWVDVVKVNRMTGHVVDGHLRVTLAIRKGEKVPVVWLNLDEDEERIALTYLDRTAEKAGIDLEILEDNLDFSVEWGLEDIAVDFADDYDIEIDFEEPPEDPGAEIDRAQELQEKWGVKTGDLWALGEHRLICGDCTDEGIVERVMGGEKAEMVFTDPPYNVASESRNYAADKSKAMNDLANAEWDKDFDVQSLFPVLERLLGEDCAVYICTSQWLVQQVWEWMWSWSDFCFYCVWCKPNPMPSLSKRHWTWATELIPYAVRGKHVSNFPNGNHALNWWNLAKNKDTDHPTEKVIEVPEKAISFSSDVGNTVFDGFLGSGTTLIACERLSRKCRAVEISPKYCSVTLERWAEMTGEQPQLLQD